MSAHNLPAERKLIEGSVEDESGCRIWVRGLTRGGYGVVSIRNKAHYVHRLAYETFVGPIPEGLVIDHLCRNRACVRPDHLEVVTYQVNLNRGSKSRGPTVSSVNHPPTERSASEAWRMRLTQSYLRALRLSRPELGAAMAKAGQPVHLQTISMWTRGRTCPTPERFAALERVFVESMERRPAGVPIAALRDAAA